MAKSMRSKREKRLRAIRREMVEPLYQEKDVAKLAAQEAALAAPKLPVRSRPSTSSSTAMDIASTIPPVVDMEVEMMTTEGSQGTKSLKPIGRKMKKKIKLSKKKRHGCGKIRRKDNC